MKEFLVTTRKRTVVTAVDDDVFEWASKVKWTITQGYVVRKILLLSGRRETQLLSRLIMSPPCGMEVDHRDGNRFNNQRRNLRLATKSQNGCNRGKNKNNTSGFKGVTWDKERSKWVAQIVVNGRSIHLGRFDDIDEAAVAYAEASLKHHGDFARTSW